VAGGGGAKLVFLRYRLLGEKMAEQGDAVCAKFATDISNSAAVAAPYEFGVLSSSVETARLGQALYRVNVGADYGPYQEFGTRYMRPQPYLVPASRYWYNPFHDAMRAVFL
jgi:HK97 gp10 family phage protein